MPKTPAQKAAKNARKRATREALMAQSPALGVGAAAARTISKVANKQHKKGGGNFWSLIGGAAKMAAELAPVIAPLFLAKHGPTMSAAQTLGATGQAAAASTGVPLAAPASCSACVGMYGMKPRYGKDGRVNGVSLRGMDYLGSLSVDGETIGTLLSEIDLNPFGSQWNGTALQRFASLFERYRPRRVCCLVEPSCPATTDGQIISYIDPDPDDQLLSLGRPAIQVASTHEGADISQVWGLNAAQYAFDSRTQDFYADADGSDERLISPGKWRVLANTTMPADTPIGSLYVIWEYDMNITQIEEFTGGGPFAYIPLTGIDSVDLLGDGTEPATAGDLQYTIDATSSPSSSSLYAMQPGVYALNYTIEGADYTSSSFDATVDGANFQTAAGSGGTLTPFFIEQNNGLASMMFVFRVRQYSDNWDDGHLIFAGLTVATSNAFVMISNIKDNFSASLANRRRTLQSFEKDVTAMKAQIQSLTSALEQRSIVPKAKHEPNKPARAAPKAIASSALSAPKP